VGLSDHTLGIGVSVAAAALGGCVIEKHLVLSRDSATVDATFSMEPDEFALLTAECQRACNSVGTIKYGPVEEGVDPYSHRRSIYVAENILAGEVFSASNLRIVRPGLGLAPRHWEDILGTKAKRDLTLGEPLSWQDIAQ
jgi:sialic acid synthase SpsE